MNSKEDYFHLGVKLLIHNKEGKLLLLEKQGRSNETYWDIPGGRLQKGETLLGALQREIEEEIGLKKIHEVTPFSMHLTNIRIPIKNDSVGLILSIYKSDLCFDFKPQLGKEHINFGWFNIFESIQLLKQYPLELINKLELLDKEKSLN